MHRLPRTVLLAAATAFAACAPAPAPTLAPAPGAVAEVRHVVVVSIDGLRPDAIEAAGARNLTALLETGAYAPDASTILPSKTLPSHTSMLTGVDVAGHGVTWNDDRVGQTGEVEVPTMFELADQAGLSTAAVFAKSKFRHLIRPGSLDWVSVRRGSEVRLAGSVLQDALGLIRHAEPNLTFVHLADADLAGHSAGWMSTPYLWAVRRADHALGEIWRAAHAEFGDGLVLLVTADHGGHGRTHGTERPEDVRIPWIAWGPTVRPGPVPEPVHTYDTAATVLWLLGVDAPQDWAGQAVKRAFGAN